MAGLIWLFQQAFTDRTRSSIPTMGEIRDIRPSLVLDNMGYTNLAVSISMPSMEIEDTDGVFGEEDTLVNDTLATVNDATATVGGSDTITSKPKLFALLDNAKPILI